jgi:YVTN family beta-propeller protein
MFGFRSLRVAFAAIGLFACAAVQAVPFAYVPNEKSGGVSVIDGASGAAVRTIATGKRPRGIAADPQGAVLYVTDTAGVAKVAEIAVGQLPWSVVIR